LPTIDYYRRAVIGRIGEDGRSARNHR